MFYDDIYKIVNPQPEVTITRQEDIQTNNPTDTIKEIVFEKEVKGNESVYKTDFPKLDKYRFKFADANWSFKDSTSGKPYTNFYVETIDDINNKEKLNLDKSQKGEFLKNLEEVSSHKVENEKVETTKQETLKKITNSSKKVIVNPKASTRKKVETEEEKEKRLLKEKTAG